MLLLDHSLQKEKKIESPVKNRSWNQFIVDILKDRNVMVNEDIKLLYEDIFDFKTNINTIPEFYEKIHNKLLKRYQFDGECYKRMVREKMGWNCCCLI